MRKDGTGLATSAPAPIGERSRAPVPDGAEDRLAAALARCAEGDRRALHVIFDEEAGRLLAVATRLVRRRDLAEEIVQDTFLQIWRKAAQFSSGEGSARGWIYAIVRNRCLNVLRDGRREDLTPDEDLNDLQDGQAWQAGFAAFSRLQTRSRLRDCLTGLDEMKRRSILMAYVSGYSHGEIAAHLGVPLGTAKAWIRRGLLALRECMA